MHLYLHDKAQQFGNLDEVAALARLSPLCVWTGDHKQNLEGSKKTEEAKTFRKKVTKRPLVSVAALRLPSQTDSWLLAEISETTPDFSARDHEILSRTDEAST